MSLTRGKLTLYEYNVNYHFDPNIYSAYAVLAAYKAWLPRNHITLWPLTH